MMTVTQRKVLLAIDGSDQSLDAVHYASKALSPQEVEVVLFHVMRKIDDAFWTMGVIYHRHSRWLERCEPLKAVENHGPPRRWQAFT